MFDYLIITLLPAALILTAIALIRVRRARAEQEDALAVFTHEPIARQNTDDNEADSRAWRRSYFG